MGNDKKPAFDFSKIFTVEWLLTALHIILIVIIGLIVIKILSSVIIKIFKKKLTPQSSMIIRKTVLYSGLVFVVIYILNRLGIELTPLLGAAGIAGIAIGFASQTSISNLISGLFLISEKPFAVGDAINIGDITGIILSIDLLSVKIRTFDNRFVRIPNEKILNNELINITRFPIRRLDIDIAVAYKEDAKKVRELLLDIVKNNPFCLIEPEPIILFKNFGNSAMEFLLGIWFEKSNYLALKNSIMEEIKERFDREGIEFPFPHRALYTGSSTRPFPVEIITHQSSNPFQE
ncbi:MAG: mechanosensitive ion channel family protein [Spirochaetales bacterium]|nr:mechanosensitive ion channel family protein [Spirochaetales bacterium]